MPFGRIGACRSVDDRSIDRSIDRSPRARTSPRGSRRVRRNRPAPRTVRFESTRRRGAIERETATPRTRERDGGADGAHARWAINSACRDGDGADDATRDARRDAIGTRARDGSRRRMKRMISSDATSRERRGGGRATEEGSKNLCASSADVARDVGATRETRGGDDGDDED